MTINEGMKQDASSGTSWHAMTNASTCKKVNDIHPPLPKSAYVTLPSHVVHWFPIKTSKVRCQGPLGLWRVPWGYVFFVPAVDFHGYFSRTNPGFDQETAESVCKLQISRGKLKGVMTLRRSLNASASFITTSSRNDVGSRSDLGKSHAPKLFQGQQSIAVNICIYMYVYIYIYKYGYTHTHTPPVI